MNYCGIIYYQEYYIMLIVKHMLDLYLCIKLNAEMQLLHQFQLICRKQVDEKYRVNIYISI